MKLLTKELEKKFPALYSTEGTPKADKIVVAKFFHPRSDWTWYAIEYDQNDKLFWGLVEGFEDEFGYFTLEELEKNGVERDMFFSPKKLIDIRL